MRLALERGMPVVSTATIYRAIYAGLFDAATKRRYPGVNKAKRKLRHRGKTRRNKNTQERRGKIIIRIKKAAAFVRSCVRSWQPFLIRFSIRCAPLQDPFFA